MTVKKQIILATKNADKVKEILRILQNPEYDLVSLLDFPDIPDIAEEGETLKENAFIKAKTAFKWTGLPSIADDTGLEVDFLNGGPGVYSSRFAGESASYHDNNTKLLNMMKDVAEEDRLARFRCVVAFITDKHDYWTEGVCEGRILTDYAGEGGFGYDPLFYVPSYDKTFAELDLAIKNQISHRGAAFRNMAAYLKQHPIL